MLLLFGVLKVLKEWIKRVPKGEREGERRRRNGNREWRTVTKEPRLIGANIILL
jgi:hypothetical protein